MTVTEQIQQLALAGVPRRSAEAAVGHEFNGEELRVFRAARVRFELLEQKRKRDKSARRPSDDAERKRRERSNAQSIARREPEDAKRRRRLEKSPEKWLKWYFPNIFTLPFSEGHRAIISAVVEGDRSGRDVVVAAPRGEGKTNILRFLSIFLVFTARARFVVVGGWQNRAASEAFSTWTIALTSERLVADYPEFCDPFAESTHANRLPRLHWAGETKPTGAAIKSAKMQIVFPDGRGAMAAGSLQSDIKGLNITTSGGESLRPDKLLLDDPQDVDRATDPAFVSDVLHKIDTQWLCLAGPNTRISFMAACTIFAPDDVGESLGKRPNSVFVKIPRVKSWPAEFERPDSECRTMWDKWFEIYCDKNTRPDALAFYRRNRSRMTDGFAVSWKHRFDRAKGDPDAFYSAMVDYYTKGREAFYSEYQNEPIGRDVNLYDVTPQAVISHTVAMKRDEPPDDTVFTVMTTDINYSYGFTYEVAAFTRGQTCHVIARGVWCQPPLPVSAKNTNQVQRQRDVKTALETFSAWISLQPWRLDAWFIDAGGEQFDTVTSFCRSARKEGRLGRAMIGRAGKSYNPLTKTQVGRIRARVYQCFTRESGRWYCFDADHYKEAGQASWITPIGQSGSATIYDGSHRDYADQMCREILEAKGVLEGRSGIATGYAYKWNTLPGKHDYLDCHAMAFAAAGYEGILSTDPDTLPFAVGNGGGVGASHSSRNHRKVYNG